MLQTSIADTPSLGADLRALRKTRSVTLAELAARLGRSVGWLSQVERGLSQPSESDLLEMAEALGVSLSLLKGEAQPTEREAGHIVRRAARRPIGKGIAGLAEDLLSPDLTDDFEMVHSTFAPGSAAPAPITRPTQEVAYMVSGHLDLTIGGREFTVGAGDSFRIRGEAQAWRNPYDQPAVAIWVIAPPVY